MPPASPFASKALLLSENFPPRTGGSSRWFWEIYSRMPCDRVVVATGEHPAAAAADLGRGLKIHRLPLSLPERGMMGMRGLWGYWKAWKSVRRVARAEGVERIHCGRTLPEGWIAWCLKRWSGLPYLCFTHGEEINLAGAERAGGLLASRELRWMTGQVLAGADFVIANSHNTADILRRQWGLPDRRVRVLHPGVDAGTFVPAPRDMQVRRELGWGDRPVVLTVGRLQLRKGHDRMIAALPAVRSAIPDVLYAIAGDGPERDALGRLAAELGVQGQVQFLGEISDSSLLYAYQQCDLFVLPNRQVGSDIEGFGIVLLEAQACGKPVVAGASGGTAEAMDAPRTGLTVPCEETEPLASTVARLLDDPSRRADMGRAARTWVEKRFDWAALADEARRILWNADPFGAARPANVPTMVLPDQFRANEIRGAKGR